MTRRRKLTEDEKQVLSTVVQAQHAILTDPLRRLGRPQIDRADLSYGCPGLSQEAIEQATHGLEQKGLLKPGSYQRISQRS